MYPEVDTAALTSSKDSSKKLGVGAFFARAWNGSYARKASAVSGDLTSGPYPPGCGAQGSSGLIKPQYVPFSGRVAQAV